MERERERQRGKKIYKKNNSKSILEKINPKQKGSMFSIFINTYEVLKEGLFVCQIQLAAT